MVLQKGSEGEKIVCPFVKIQYIMGKCKGDRFLVSYFLYIEMEAKEMTSQKKRTEKLALRGMLLAVAFVLSWVEAQLPPLAAVPGVKLGLTNLVVLVALYRLGTKDALILNVVRIVLVSLTFGNLFSLLYSLAGGILSAAVMILLKKTGSFRMTGVSLAGGIFHNVGQILVAMVVLESSGVLYYMGVLWISGMLAGIAVGLVGAQLVKRLPAELM